MRLISRRAFYFFLLLWCLNNIVITHLKSIFHHYRLILPLTFTWTFYRFFWFLSSLLQSTSSLIYHMECVRKFTKRPFSYQVIPTFCRIRPIRRIRDLLNLDTFCSLNQELFQGFQQWYVERLLIIILFSNLQWIHLRKILLFWCLTRIYLVFWTLN